MKYIVNLLVTFCAILCMMTTKVIAQNTAHQGLVPISVYIPNDTENIPLEAHRVLLNKFKAAASQCGMGATEDFAQFYITCSSTKVDMQVIAGAPPKYRQELELSVYVIDAFSNKIFGSVTLPVHGVGESETKSYMACFKQLSPSNGTLKSFLLKTNKGIINYYEGQINNIISMAQSLAKVYKYDEALFRLSLVPEACPSYNIVMEEATKIYQKYIDDQANRCLAKARSIWNAGQDFTAASEAGEYLAEILPEAKCYNEALELANTIKKRVGDDIEYYRKLESRDADRAHQQRMSEINAWKEVGVAYGKNQKDIYYGVTLL